MFSLEGKVAVVTGAASGFGKATSLRFSKAGAKVVLADIQDAVGVAEEAGGVYVETDVSKEDQVRNVLQKAVDEFGKLDIVVNNAGIGGIGVMVEGITDENLTDELNINFKSVVWGIKHAVPLISDGGSIMNTASYAGLFGTPTYGTYVAAKAAIIAITKTAALELAPRGIRVNCICPGTADTPMSYTEGGEVELKLANYLQPLGRLAQPEEIAALYHFLASDDSSFITGVAIPIDGGMSAGPSVGVIMPLYEKICEETLDMDDFRSEG